MKHSNRDDMQKNQQQVAQPVVVKQKSSFYHKLKLSCCFVVFVAFVAGGIYLYQFYQTVKAEINVEIDQNKELYQDTKDTIEKVNENYQEINAAVDHGKDLIDDAKEIKENIDDLK